MSEWIQTYACSHMYTILRSAFVEDTVDLNKKGKIKCTRYTFIECSEKEI